MSIILYNLCNHELRVFRVKPSRDDGNNGLSVEGSDAENYYKYLGIKLEAVKCCRQGEGTICHVFTDDDIQGTVIRGHPIRFRSLSCSWAYSL